MTERTPAEECTAAGEVLRALGEEGLDGLAPGLARVMDDFAWAWRVLRIHYAEARESRGMGDGPMPESLMPHNMDGVLVLARRINEGFGAPSS